MQYHLGMSLPMRTHYLWLFLLVIAISCSPKSTVIQEETASAEPTPLITIGEEDIYADEFLYLLSKNRKFDEKENKLTSEEFEENFNLFVNYKLKVKEAESLGLDTLEEFRREYDVFKEDLIKPYLIKNTLQEGELMKAYNRMKEVVKASHILLQFPANSSQEDSIAVFRMAQKLKEEAETGTDFNDLAYEHSDDPSAKENRGSLGNFTALQMVHQFEDAVYNLNVGEISDPILTDFGYHIIKLEGRKPNPGEIKVSHILVRTQTGDPVAEERALRKVGDIYNELQKPESVWEEITQIYSDDTGSKNSGGQLPWIGLGTVIPEFERVAFALNEIGEISPPVKSPYGYHIIRLDDRKPIADYEEMEPIIKSRIMRDSRATLIQSQVSSIQKSRYRFIEREAIQTAVKKAYDADRAKAFSVLKNQNMLDSILFTIRDSSYTVEDFTDYIANTRQPARVGADNYYDIWMQKFIETKLSEAEELDLRENNKEYKALLQEYRDGILLFSLMNEQVWQKALMDSAGQIAFFENNRNNYVWKERAEALLVTIGQEESLPGVRRFLKDKVYKKDLADRLENTFLLDNPLAFTMDEGIYEIESHPILSKVDKSKNNQEVKLDNKIYFVILGDRKSSEPKKFMETRGKVIQDYQEFLDQELVASLKNNYTIQVYEDEKQKVHDRVVHN